MVLFNRFVFIVLALSIVLADKGICRTSQLQGILERSPGILLRERRNAKIIGDGVLQGLRAVKTLLSGAKLTQSRYNLVHQYEKPGTYDKVVEEFYSVNPTDVRDFHLPGVPEPAFHHRVVAPSDWAAKLRYYVPNFPTADRVKTFDKVVGKTGRTGDRIILIENEGELGKPIMEIYQNKGTQYERLDRIIYTNREMKEH